MKNWFERKDSIKNIEFSNRICINPMEGSDAALSGAPGELTFRRYKRFARSGAGLIWFEAVAVCPEGKASKTQLMITEDTLGAFRSLAKDIKDINPEIKIICQLTHSGRFSRPHGTPAPILAFRDENIETRYPAHKAFEAVSDDYLDKLPARFLKSAALLKSAGFDGVDIKMCHRYLLSELLAGFTRPGKYGGSYENRTRLIKNVFSEVGKLADENFLLCSRMGIYDAIEYPFGFGVDKKDKSLPDFGEPICLINELAEMGLSLVNVTMGTPYYNPYVNKPHRSGFADPLGAVNTLLDGAAVIKAECPGVKVVSTGYSYLKTDAFDRGNAMLCEGKADFIGFGRLAFSYEGFAKDILLNNGLSDAKCCIACNKCSELLRLGISAGCVIKDREIYLPIYRENIMNAQSAVGRL